MIMNTVLDLSALSLNDIGQVPISRGSAWEMI